jgi:hypothetical protein
MDVQQIIEMLKAYQEKVDADRKADQERWKAERKVYEEKRMAEQKADQERRKAESKAYEEKRMAEQKADQERRKAESKSYEEKRMAEQIADREKLQDKMKAYREDFKSDQAKMIAAFKERMDALIANITIDRKETTASQEDTETKPDPEKMQSVEEHQQIPKEDAAVMPVGGLRKRRRDRNLAAGRRQKPKRKDRETSSRNSQLVTKNKKMDLVEGTAPSETEKVSCTG